MTAGKYSGIIPSKFNAIREKSNICNIFRTEKYLSVAINTISDTIMNTTNINPITQIRAKYSGIAFENKIAKQIAAQNNEIESAIGQGTVGK